MQFELTKKIGKTTFVFKKVVQNHCEFMKLASFLQELPETGPNGEEDVRLVHRHVRGNDFYSLICDSAGMEYKLGQYKTPREGELYCKGVWAPVFRNQESAVSSTPTPAGEQQSPVASEQVNSVLEGYL